MPTAFTLSPDAGPSDPLQGVMAPVITPLTSERELDVGSLRRHVAHLIEAGVGGLWVNGTTGEFYGLDARQRSQVVSSCVAAANGAVPVIAHVGDASLSLATDHARSALEAGAQHLSVLAPYVVGFSQDELKEHFRALAAVAGGPVIAYHMPQIIDPGLTIESIVELAGEGVIGAAKDSSSDVLWLRKLVESGIAAGHPVPCFTGGSAVTDLGYFVGAAGAMSSTTNIVPRHLVAQYESARRGDWDDVRARQRQTDELMTALRLPGRHAPSAVAGIYKYVLTALGQLSGDWGVEPLRDLTAEEKERLLVGVVPMIEKLERTPIGI